MDKASLVILIIEDDLVIAENLREILLETGFAHICIAKDYQSVKALKATVNPDLFLVDIHLERSEKDGIDIMLHEFDAPSKPLIYISSLADQETRDRAKRTNPSAYLVKPFTSRQLEVAIDFAVTNHYLRSSKGREVVIDHCPFISEPDYFYVKVKERYERVNKSDIVLLHSEGTYTDIVTTGKKVKHYLHLKILLDRLHTSHIVRCHNSYAVNTRHIHAFDHEHLYIMLGGEIISVPMSQSYKGLILDKMVKL